jgi:hypothetical protein
VGDAKGAALLAKIAQRVDQIDNDLSHNPRRDAIRRHRHGSFGPST